MTCISFAAPRADLPSNRICTMPNPCSTSLPARCPRPLTERILRRFVPNKSETVRRSPQFTDGFRCFDPSSAGAYRKVFSHSAGTMECSKGKKEKESSADSLGAVGSASCSVSPYSKGHPARHLHRCPDRAKRAFFLDLGRRGSGSWRNQHAQRQQGWPTCKKRCPDPQGDLATPCAMAT